MADRKTTSVDALYTEGRHYPRGQNRDTGARRSLPHETPMETASARDAAFNKNTNQDPIDQLGPKYRADVADDWRRGGGKGGATSRPGFDKSGAWRAGRDGVSHGAGDPAIIRKPERNKP